MWFLEMTLYFVFYAVIILLLVLSYIFNNSRYILVLAILVTLFFSGFRHETGYDWFNYSWFYTLGLHYDQEPFFVASIIIMNFFSENPQVLFFCYSFSTLLVLLLAVQRLSTHYKTSYLIYLLIPSLFISSFSILRQGLALAILLYALSFLFEDRKKEFVLLSFVSASFHYSAIIPAIMFIVCRSLFFKSYKTIYYVIFLIVSCVLYFANTAPKLLGLAFGRYAAYIELTHGVTILKIAVINLFIFILLAYRRQYVKNWADTYMLNLIVFGTFITNVFANFSPMTRLSYYFFIVQIVLMPKLIYSFKSNNARFMSLALVILYYLMMNSYALKFDNELDQYPKLTPYKNFFLNDIA